MVLATRTSADRRISRSTMLRAPEPLGTFPCPREAAPDTGRLETIEWHPQLGRRRDQTAWTGWLISAVLHAVLVLLLSIALLPIDLGESGDLLVELSCQSDDAPLETFTMSADDLIESVSIPDAAEPQVVQETVLDILGSPASGAVGDGGDGWQNGSARQKGGAGGRTGTRARYFGTVAYGDRFVYALDFSVSMDRRTGISPSDGTRFERACAELLRSIDQLTEDQSFYVVLFCEETLRMFDSKSVLPRMVPATSENKDKLKYWLGGITLGSGTDPRESLRLGLELQPSAIFLLSDGEFNGHKNGYNKGVFVGNPKVSEVVQRSNSGQTPIHTFAYEDPVNCERMAALATQTGGTYRFIPGAPERNPPEPDPPDPVQQRNRRADVLLRMAMSLESSGRRAQALKRYGNIEREFPDTEAAEKCRELLRQLSLQ